MFFLFFEPIIAFFLLLEVRKILKASDSATVWNKKIKLAMFAIIGLYLLEIFFPIEKVTLWIWHLLLIAIISTIYFNAVFKAARGLIYAVLPLVIISLFSDLFKLLLNKNYHIIETYVEVAILFSIIWMIVLLIISKKQRRALEKERLKTQAKEELNLKLSQQKAELETIVYNRTSELVKQKEELEKVVVNLKATQSQLIQSEKMASLGELTAGIAHEIQNPLNFVNNFSEINNELITELKEAINKGNIKEVMSLANAVAENELKITHHGKRADAIVKGMLLHSRSNSGQKEPTDINALSDEYLRLAYHGLRAKDKSFNAVLKTDFDETIDNVKIVPQDIGRVILNLITNAFYAVKEKNTLRQGQGDNYEPTVSVSTKKMNGKVEIKVADNGNGIPQKVLDKIFQPFFTTKPTGQGTGLGLSICYDIVKAHSGDLKVETKEGEGSEFYIYLPAN